MKSSLKWVYIVNNINAISNEKKCVFIIKKIISIAVGILALNRYLYTIGVVSFSLNSMISLPLKKTLSVISAIYGLIDNLETLWVIQRDLAKISCKKSLMEQEGGGSSHQLEKRLNKLKLKRQEVEAELNDAQNHQSLIPENQELIKKIAQLFKDQGELTQDHFEMKKKHQVFKSLQKAMQGSLAICTGKKKVEVELQIEEVELLKLMDGSVFRQYKWSVYEKRQENCRNARIKKWISVASNIVKIVALIPMISKVAYGAQFTIELFGISSEAVLNKLLIYLSMLLGSVGVGRFLFKELCVVKAEQSPSEFFAQLQREV